MFRQNLERVVGKPQHGGPEACVDHIGFEDSSQVASFEIAPWFGFHAPLAEKDRAGYPIHHGPGEKDLTGQADLNAVPFEREVLDANSAVLQMKRPQLFILGAQRELRRLHITRLSQQKDCSGNENHSDYPQNDSPLR